MAVSYKKIAIPKEGDWIALIRALHELDRRYSIVINALRITNEIPPESVPNNKSFSTVYKYVTNTLEVYYNGVLYRPGIDYYEDSDYQGFTFIAPLRKGRVQVNYVRDLT